MAQGLQGTLPAAVRAEVHGAVSEAFRSAFAASIVPAFEQAMHVMFKQVRYPPCMRVLVQIRRSVKNPSSVASVPWQLICMVCMQVDEAVNQGLAEHLAAMRAAMADSMPPTPQAHPATHTPRAGIHDAFNPDIRMAPQRHEEPPMSSVPVATTAVAADTFAQPHIRGPPVTNLAVQSASISDLIDSDRHGSAMYGARAFQAGPARGPGQGGGHTPPPTQVPAASPYPTGTDAPPFVTVSSAIHVEAA